MTIRRIAAILPAALLLFALVSISHAQVESFSQPIQGEGSDITITTTPASPGPDQIVELTAQSSLLDLQNADITWSAGGKTIAQGEGATSATITTGALGAPLSVAVSAVNADGSSASASATIIPTQVDLLFDADSYTPPFYRGRALPSPGTSLHFQAIARFVKSDGSLVPSNDIIYTWRQDGEVAGTASGLGRSSAILPSPSLFGTDTIEVDAASTDGIFSGEASVSIPSVDPSVTLYEDHPLFGVMYWDALPAQASIPDQEMAFAAVPYFALAQSSNDPSLAYAWTVNGSPVTTQAGSGNEITINAAGSSGVASVAVSLTSPSNYLLDATGQWQITFGAAGAGSSPQDAFHQ